MLRLTRRQWTIIFLTIIILVLSFFILPVSLPLILAFLTALSLNPLVNLLEAKFKFKRHLSVISIYLIFVVVIAFLGSIAITNTITQLVSLAENLPDYIVQINDLFLSWSNDLERILETLPKEFIDEVNTSIMSSIDTLTSFLRTNLRVERLAAFVAVIPNYIVSFIVYLIALFLFMMELPTLKVKFYHNFTDQTTAKIQFMTDRLKYVFVGFIKAQFLVSLIILAVSLVGLFLILPEYAVIMSLIIWIIDLIPIIGSIVILGPWAIYMFFSGNIVMGTQLTILAIVLLAIRRTVEPKVMGQHIGLSPLATLIAMYIGLKLFGIFGFIIGPLTIIAFTSAKEAGIIKWNLKL
ncbi:sporulation integral membrane protein YtvI [Amphibacillus marinus]|uniref:Sporulation integral membrane protein YtvI n=1 Tax=Amphibacillus marinus TaxID=872970 RepID=A0A1H8I6R4_9BACI|nr:sporulation integral membrane protein YtvI [Amphibacillus marinus]